MPEHLSSQSQGITLPYNQACVCMMRPCSWDSDDSSACLCLSRPHLSPCFPGALGLHRGAGSLGWPALR